MKQTRALALAGLLILSASAAIAADDHKPKYGGQVRETKGYELVAKDRELTLYLNEHASRAPELRVTRWREKSTA